MRISDWSSDVCSSDLVNSSRSAYIMGSDGKRVRMRTAINDTRGHIAELLAKALSQGSLDQALTAADKEKLLPFLKAYGDLGADYRFTGTERSEEHTSELQSLMRTSYAVFCLKKKNKKSQT